MTPRDREAARTWHGLVNGTLLACAGWAILILSIYYLWSAVS